MSKSRHIVLMSLAQLLQTVVSLVTMVGAVALYPPGLVALQLVAVLPVAFCETYFSTAMHKLFSETTPLRRTMEYLMTLATSTNSVKEVKLYHFGEHIVGEYDALGRRFQQENARLSRKRNIVGGLLSRSGRIAFAQPTSKEN